MVETINNETVIITTEEVHCKLSWADEGPLMDSSVHWYVLERNKPHTIV